MSIFNSLIFNSLAMKGLPSIIHEAVVSRVDEAESRVDVVVADHGSEECGACAAAALCRRKNGNVLSVRVKSTEKYRPGMSVRIGACVSMHHKAVGLMLALPCLVLVSVTAGLALGGCSEGLSALGGIGGAALTYAVLYMCRRRLGGNLEFEMVD